MNKILRDIGLVTRYELQDAVRSRRAVVMLGLYLVAAVLSCNGFIGAMHRIEAQVAEMLQIQAPDAAGTMTETLWKSDRFRHMIRDLVGDADVAEGLFGQSPMVLIYGWLAFMYTPLLVVLTASGRVAEEVASGSARFALFRTPRLSWCLGKFLGQAGLIFLALVLNAAGAWCVARFRMPGADGAVMAQGMLLFAGRAWLYALPFLGLSLGVSQLTRSPNLALVFSIVAMAGLSLLYWVSRLGTGEGFQRVGPLVRALTPQGHRLDLWRMDAPHLVTAGAYLATLGLVYLALGHLFFRRRDL